MAALQIVDPAALAGRFLFGVSWGNSPLGLALLLGSFASPWRALATLLGAVLRTPAQATSVGWIRSMVMAALGGCWWPGELMPDWMRNAAHALPTAWAMDGLHALISFGRGLEAVLAPRARAVRLRPGFLAPRREIPALRLTARSAGQGRERLQPRLERREGREGAQVTTSCSDQSRRFLRLSQQMMPIGT